MQMEGTVTHLHHTRVLVRFDQKPKCFMTISIFAFKEEFIGKSYFCFVFLFWGAGDIILCLFVIFAIYHFGFEDRMLVLIVTVPSH